MNQLVLKEGKICILGFSDLKEEVAFHMLVNGLTITQKKHNTPSEEIVMIKKDEKTDERYIDDADMIFILKHRGLKEGRTWDFLLIDEVYYLNDK